MRNKFDMQLERLSEQLILWEAFVRSNCKCDKGSEKRRFGTCKARHERR